MRYLSTVGKDCLASGFSIFICGADSHHLKAFNLTGATSLFGCKEAAFCFVSADLVKDLQVGYVAIT